MKSWPSLTAELVCLARALEAERRNPILRDTLARGFLRRPIRDAPFLPFLPPEFVTSIAARHAWLDEEARAVLPEVDQLLVLGAGYDTRCWRLTVPERSVEMDHPATATRKWRRVRELGLQGGESHPVDLSQTPIEQAIHESALERVPTLVIWEGVSMYLTPPTIRATLDGLASALGPDCRVLMDLWERNHQSIVSRSVEGAAARALSLIGEPIRARLHEDEWTVLLDEAGWTRVRDATLGEAASRHGRTARLALRTVHLAQTRHPAPPPE